MAQEQQQSSEYKFSRKQIFWAMVAIFAVYGAMSYFVQTLNIPTGIFSLIGPTLGGWFVDKLSWRHLFWISLDAGSSD